MSTFLRWLGPILLGALFVALVLLLSACGTVPTYYKDGTTQEQFNKDLYDCQQAAAQYAANMGAPANPLVIGPEVQECMTRKHGYTIGPKQT